MSNLFENCCSLSTLPNISKWNFENVEDISRMFYNCNSLISFDINFLTKFHFKKMDKIFNKSNLYSKEEEKIKPNDIKLFLNIFIFHFDISGIFFKEKQQLNTPCILVIFDVFHFEISGKYSSNSHPENILFISIIFSVFHFDISGKDFNDEHP